MSKLNIKDVTNISNEIFKSSIPHIEDSLNEVFKNSPIDVEIKKAILNSVVASQKISIDTTVALLAQLVNAQDN